MRTASRLSLAVVLLVSMSTLHSCEFPGSDGGWVPDVIEPGVEPGEVVLTKSPSFAKMAAYYCPMVYDAPAVESLCEAALGVRPALSQMIFEFQLPLLLTNENEFAVPAVELLTTLQVFPGQTSQELGALCVQFCEANDPNCGDTQPGACVSDEPEINSIDDFADAAGDFISLWIDSTVNGEVPPELAVRMIPAGGSLELRLTFRIAPEPILEVLITLFEQNIDSILGGEEMTIEIPYQVNGSLWFVVENFGKFGVNFGPVDDTWVF